MHSSFGAGLIARRGNSLPLHIGLRRRVGWTVEFPDWVCWKGAKKGREREKAVIWASVVKESVLAVSFHGSNDGRVRVYKNPEDQTLKSCARSGGEGWHFGFLFLGELGGL